MTDQFCISVIVPFYNSELSIKRCINSILKQDFEKTFEIIMIDDASTDNSKKIIKKQNSSLIKLISLPKNSGPAAARNAGLKIAKGEYIFFLDADDTILNNTFSTLYENAKENDFDLVFCDKKRIQDSQNKREHNYVYSEDKVFNNSNILEEIKKRLFDPNYMQGVVGLHGKLIKKSIITNNKLSFQNELRYLEDETFVWDILGYVNNMKYVRIQLYSYYSNENLNTARSEGLSRDFPLSNFKIIKNHVQNCFKTRGVSSKEIVKLGDQALIFFIIYALVSLSLSMLTGKANYEKGFKYRRKIIDDINVDPDVLNAIKNYSCSKNESPWIPKSIFLRSRKLIELTCTGRANKIIKNMRRDVRAV